MDNTAGKGAVLIVLALLVGAFVLGRGFDGGGSDGSLLTGDSTSGDASAVDDASADADENGDAVAVDPLGSASIGWLSGRLAHLSLICS